MNIFLQDSDFYATYNRVLGKICELFAMKLGKSVPNTH